MNNEQIEALIDWSLQRGLAYPRTTLEQTTTLPISTTEAVSQFVANGNLTGKYGFVVQSGPDGKAFSPTERQLFLKILAALKQNPRDIALYSSHDPITTRWTPQLQEIANQHTWLILLCNDNDEVPDDQSRDLQKGIPNLLIIADMATLTANPSYKRKAWTILRQTISHINGI